MMPRQQAARLAQFYRTRFTSLSFVLFLVLAIGLVLVAGLRSGDGIPDLAGYRQWYSEGFSLTEYFANPALIFQKDPGFYLLSAYFFSHGFPFQAFLCFIALFGVGWKMKGIATLSNSPWASALVYISFYFLMHEMVQIRAGLASGLFLLSLPYLQQRRYGVFTLVILFASCFHYSAIILLGLLFLTGECRHPRWYLAALLGCFVAALCGFSPTFLMLHLPGSDSNTRVAYYLLEAQNDGIVLNLFSRMTIPNLILCVTLLLNFDRLKEVTPYASLVIRIFCLSQMAFYLLSGWMAFAVRLSDLLGIVGILAWPLFFHLFRPFQLRVAVAGLVCLNFFTTTIRIFNPSTIQKQSGRFPAWDPALRHPILERPLSEGQGRLATRLEGRPIEDLDHA